MTLLYCLGMDDNETIRINRGGGADPEGDLPGDLYVKLKVKSPPFCITSRAGISKSIH